MTVDESIKGLYSRVFLFEGIFIQGYFYSRIFLFKEIYLFKDIKDIVGVRIQEEKGFMPRVGLSCMGL